MTRHYRRIILAVPLLVALAGVAMWLMARSSEPIQSFDDSAQDLLARSRVIRDRAWPGYQKEVLATLGRNPYIGMFYRLDEMLEQAMLQDSSRLFMAKERAANVLAFEFDARDGVGFDSRGGNSVVWLRDGYITVTQSSRAGHLASAIPLRIPKDDVGSIHVRARSDGCSMMTLAWSREHDLPLSEAWKSSASIDMVADSTFHIYEIDATHILTRGLDTGDSIRSLLMQFHPTCHVTVDYIRFVSKLSKYVAHPFGSSYERIGKEVRRTLYMLPTQNMQFWIDVPANSPTLDFGNAVLTNAEPLTFAVTVSEQGQQAVGIYQRTIQNRDLWYDTRLDLSKWAGRKVRLTLKVSGTGPNVAFWSNPLVSSEPKKRFNVILIVQDALRADHLSGYGNRLLTSPAMDSVMAERGTVFLNAIAQATQTRPSVPSMMTSLLPSTTGVWHLGHRLSEAYLTLPEVLRAQGFVTASFVQNNNAGADVGLHQGYSVLRDPETLGEATEGILGEQVLSWLQRNRERNFFLYLHILDPHGVYDPPAPYDSWYRENASRDGATVERRYFDPEWLAHPTAEGRNLLYDGEIRHNDELLRSFVAALDTLGLRRNTLLILTADHGEHLGERGLWGHRPPGYLQVIGVPLMLSYPERFPKPKRVPQTVQLIDVMPTILDLAAIDSDELAMAGSSLVELLEGRNMIHWEDRLVVSEEPMATPRRTPCACGSILFRGWHLIGSKKLRGVPRVPDRRALSYRGDGRAESRPSLSPLGNYLAWFKQPGVMRELQANNREARKRFRRGDGAEVLKVDPEVLERLRDLGYINQ